MKRSNEQKKNIYPSAQPTAKYISHQLGLNIDRKTDSSVTNLATNQTEKAEKKKGGGLKWKEAVNHTVAKVIS